MRKFAFFIILVVTVLSYLFRVDEYVASKFSFLNEIKLSYIDKIVNFSNLIEKYFNQTTTIVNLTKENEELKQYKILYNSLQSQLNDINSTSVNIDNLENLSLSRVISYLDFNDFSKVYLDFEKNHDKIYGLITDNAAAGIAITQDGKSIGLLNGNEDCSYAVFIGENKVPGIATAIKNKNELLIKFIPSWQDINEGDEVITSGMDDIFFEGLKVGIVKKVNSLSDMKTAIVKPYANVIKNKYFYIYKN